MPAENTESHPLPTALAELVDAVGPVRPASERPIHHAPGVSNDTISAIGKLSAALETCETARGHLYAFHRLSGTADREVQHAVAALRDSGEREIAHAVTELLVGRNVVADMWSFEIVERYDDQYWSVFRAVLAAAQHAAGITEPHVHEAGMKRDEQLRSERPS